MVDYARHVILHVRVPSAVAQRLASMAEREDLPQSAIVRRALVAFLPAIEPVTPRPSPVTSSPSLSTPRLSTNDRPLGERLAEVTEAFAQLAADLRSAVGTIEDRA